MTTIPLRRAYQGEEAHHHFRNDGWGIAFHQHVVRSELHSHPGEGLGMTRLSWAVWGWIHTRDVAVYAGHVAMAVGATLLLAVVLTAAAWAGTAR